MKEALRKAPSKEDKKNLDIMQLLKTSEDAFEKLKKAYEKQDAETFNRYKAVLIQTQRRLAEII